MLLKKHFLNQSVDAGLCRYIPNILDGRQSGSPFPDSADKYNKGSCQLK